jgi:hypothetical protein
MERDMTIEPNDFVTLLHAANKSLIRPRFDCYQHIDINDMVDIMTA